MEKIIWNITQKIPWSIKNIPLERYKFELKSIDEIYDNSTYDIINLSYVLQHLEKPQEV